LPFYGIGSTASGLHTKLDLRGYRGFGSDDQFVLAGRLQFRSIFGAEIDRVPPGLLFFSGGGGTVRGQAFESLGVDLGGGDISGGRSFLGLSGELRAKITKTIGVVGFYDTGYISADSIPASDSPNHSGAGVGLRYYTGIGAIRLDVAQAVNGGGDGGVQFYIGIGQAF
jgi:translocation and assembly module TamA